MSFFFGSRNYEDEYYDEYYPKQKKQRTMQIDKQTQDNIRILDTMIRTMSTAENLCGIKYKAKKYNIDHKDISSFKTHEQIRDDFLMNIQCLNTMIQIFKKRNNSSKPKILPPYDKNSLKYDLENFRKIAISKDPALDKYFKDFSNLIDGYNCQTYSENEMLTSHNKPESIDEQKINKFAGSMLKQSEKENRKMKKALEKYSETGHIDLNDYDNEKMECDFEEDPK